MRKTVFMIDDCKLSIVYDDVKWHSVKLLSEISNADCARIIEMLVASHRNHRGIALLSFGTLIRDYRRSCVSIEISPAIITR
jgi:hypothetical protein